MAVISGLSLVYRLFTFLIPEVRHELLRRKFHASKIELRDLGRVNLKLDYGDWFLLYQIGKNMRPAAFCDFLAELVRKFSKGRIINQMELDDDDYLDAHAKEKEKKLS